MNYLAHVLLAGPEDGWRLGAYLGDHVRGHDWQSWPDPVWRGILQHRRIDRSTDHHPSFLACKAVLRPALRRYAGIVIDMVFDHLIARDFSAYSALDHEQLAEQCYALLDRHMEQLPPSLQRFARYQKEHRLLTSYAQSTVLIQSVRGVSQRLSRPVDLVPGVEDLLAEPQVLTECMRLFADLEPLASREKQRLISATMDSLS